MADKHLVKQLAALSRIDIEECEVGRLAAEMDEIIALMDMVKNFPQKEDTFALDAKDYKELRADRADISYSSEDVVKNAKVTNNNAFTVPKIV